MSVDADADADVDAEGIRIVLSLLRRGELKRKERKKFSQNRAMDWKKNQSTIPTEIDTRGI